MLSTSSLVYAFLLSELKNMIYEKEPCIYKNGR